MVLSTLRMSWQDDSRLLNIRKRLDTQNNMSSDHLGVGNISPSRGTRGSRFECRRHRATLPSSK